MGWGGDDAAQHYWASRLIPALARDATSPNKQTELSPLGTSCTLKGKHLRLDQDEKYGLLFKQVRFIIIMMMMR